MVWHKYLTRRCFLTAISAAFAGSMIGIRLWQWGKYGLKKPSALSAWETEVLEDVMSVIIPTDESPGAQEAKTINYLLNWLAEENQQEILRFSDLVRQIDRESHIQGKVGFPSLSKKEQEQVVQNFLSRGGLILNFCGLRL